MRIDRIPSKKKNGKVHFTVLLRHAYRNEEGKTRHRTLANLTHFPPEDILAIEWALKNKDLACILANREGDNPLRQGLSVGAVAAIYQILEDLGVVKVLGKSQEGKLVLWMIMAYLIGQGSDLSLVYLAERHAVFEILDMKPFCEDHLYKALSWLDKKQPEIEQRLYELRREIKRKGKEKKGKKLKGKASPEGEFFFFNIVIPYLESMLNRAYGDHQENKKGNKEIVVGLLTDEEGFPVSLQVYSGNAADSQTVLHQVKKTKEAFGARGVTFVGDKSIIPEKEWENLKKEGFHYIFVITEEQNRSLFKKKAFQKCLLDKGLGEFEYGGERYILYRNPNQAHEKQEKKRKKQEAVIEKELESLDECCLVGTNLRKEDGFPKELVYSKYKALDKIKGYFHSKKTSSHEMHPRYAKTKGQIRAHMLILLLTGIVKQKLEEYWKDLDITVQEGIDELSTLTSIEILLGDKRIHHVPKPNQRVQKLLEAAHVTIPKSFALSKRECEHEEKTF